MDIPILVEIHTSLSLGQKLWLLCKIYWHKYLKWCAGIYEWFVNPPPVTTIITDPEEVEWWRNSGMLDGAEVRVSKQDVLYGPFTERDFLNSAGWYNSYVHLRSLPQTSYYVASPRYYIQSEVDYSAK